MSGAPRLRSMNVTDSEARPVLGPAGNKAGSLSARKPASKPSKKVEKSSVEVTVVEEKKALPSSTVNSLSPKTHSLSVPSVLRRHERLLHSSLSLNASCSSDASTDSFQSRASTDPSYAAFHDEEWGVPVHDDKYVVSSVCLLIKRAVSLTIKFRLILLSTCRKLFELLVLSGSLSELTWSAILSKRHIFREVFMDFDPVAVSKLNEKKLIAHGSVASSLLSELMLRAIVENARQISKVIDEFRSFDQYIWSFVNHKPIVSRFRYPRQVPVKTPKADVISKDLVRRGFRSVGPTVIYSFMQVAGITNDHLTSCFRFQECITAAEAKEENVTKDTTEKKETVNVINTELSVAIDELSFSTE
ncbi:hypothetical protein E1A91_D05G058900v1 [Gossypium mustelinum]|uniref:Uncharacterized protein n=1 Tax=Gossypium mustelinum TaxID=34275 RepID=A0A5D2UR95_GOSMU|nr:hypothetical protein E1A91_D05G058900v1 [Gossypium mustelinum]